MGEKEESPLQQAPVATLHAGTTDMESSAAQGAAAAKQQRKKKRTKCILYIILFIIFQSAIIAIFTLTIMKVRTPRFRIREATVTDFNAGAPANPSLRAQLYLRFSVKNANFGRYKYHNTTVVFKYRGTPVGEVEVPRSRAKWRSTKKVSFGVDLNLGNGTMDSQLSSDLNAGIVEITSEAKMRGRVELLFVFKKNRSTDMNCSILILTGTQQISNIACK